MTMGLAEQIGTGVGPGVLPSHMYYRQANGWVKPALATELEELKYRREGWEPLIQYGKFDLVDDYTVNHPLEALFIMGGAGEMQRDQIMQMGFHLHPPLVPVCGMPIHQFHKRHLARCWVGARPVRFHQLDGESFEPFPCRFCEVEKATEKARDQHETVMHKAERGDIRTGETLGRALTQGLGPIIGQATASQATATPALAADVEAAAQAAVQRLLGKLRLSKKQKEKLGLRLEAANG